MTIKFQIHAIHITKDEEVQKQSYRHIFLDGLDFLVLKFLKSNFASFLLELNSNNAYKERSKESDLSRRICGETSNDICCGEQLEEQSKFVNFSQ
jgi:hypothetical protein